MGRSDWVKIGTFTVGLFIASGIPAAVHLGRRDAELVEARSRVGAAESMIMATRQRVDDSYSSIQKELFDISSRLSRIEGRLERLSHHR